MRNQSSTLVDTIARNQLQVARRVRGSPHLASAEPGKILEKVDAAAYSLECPVEIALERLPEVQDSARCRFPSGERQNKR